MYTVFSPGGKDCVGVERKSQLVGVFDTKGNGVVFDEDGATRLSYNQIGGIWRDNPTGPPLLWKWDVDEKNSVVKTVYAEKSAVRIEKFLPPRVSSPLKSSRSGKPSTLSASPRNKEKKVVKQKPVVPAHNDEEEEVGSGHDVPCDYTKDTYSLKMICMKLTDYISLRILNRREIYLRFFANGKTIRIELGTILNFNKEVASYFVDTSVKDAMLKCKFDDLLTSHFEPDDSLHDLAQELRKVRKSGRQRKLMIKKYKPYLSVWNSLKTRCRP
ncbi:PREDICTED: uncharacterized protein LOC107193457 [Dufourea novaeangliae]|nr:PREDICTED: uncharacterized protein LOC107193457 [Dufourea novaeangliae]